MITAEILNVEKVISLLQKLPEDAKSSMKRAVLRLAILLQNYVKENELSGQALHVRTGRLRRSITAKEEDDGYHFTGIVGTNVEYARIQEYGGTTKPHRIEPRNGKALMFIRSGVVDANWYFSRAGKKFIHGNMTSKSGRYLQGGKAQRIIKAAIERGDLVFARGVNHPGSKIPEHSFLRAGMRAVAPDLREGLIKALQEALK